MIRSFIFIFILLLSYFVSGQERVLFIGNSYTYMNNLPDLVQNIAKSNGKMIQTGAITVGGSTLKGHAMRISTYEKMMESEWDIVIFQGHSRELTYDTSIIRMNTFPYLNQMMDSIKRKNPCARFAFFMTWGYADGHRDSIPEDTYELMQKRIIHGYQYLYDNFANTKIIPVGKTWHQLLTENSALILHSEDRAHPSLIGSYAAACTVYSSLFNDTNDINYCPASIDRNYAAQITTSVRSIISSNSFVYTLEPNIIKNESNPKIQVKRISRKKIKVTFNDLSITNFSINYGDNTLSTDKSKHRYRKKGHYKISVHYTKNCQTFQFETNTSHI